jgi:hypothetical protein
MEVPTSRILLHPREIEHSLGFYEQTLGLAIYRGAQMRRHPHTPGRRTRLPFHPGALAVGESIARRNEPRKLAACWSDYCSLRCPRYGASG